jgi:hypothetical protein
MTRNKVEAVVVSYDPVRRNGFMRVTSSPPRQTIHFTLNMLPEGVRQPVIVASRAINQAKKDGTPPERFQTLMNQVRGMVQGQRFRFALKDGERVIIDRHTVEHLSG